MEDKYAPLEPGGIYHVYNRAIGYEKLFLSDDNYRFFLKKYEHYIQPFAETYCYCLMSNHFHFLVKIKEENLDLTGFESLKDEPNLQGFQNLEGLLSRQFSNFFNAYAKAFNKIHNRKGSLFMHTYKRKRVTDEKYLRKVIHYIHYNPVEAGIVAKIGDWKYSSYKALSTNSQTKLNRKAVLKLFESRKNFVYCHQIEPTLSGVE